MVVAGLGGCPLLTVLRATTSSVPLVVASDRTEFETVMAGPPGARVSPLIT